MLHWHSLENEAQLLEYEKQSYDNPVVLFKHNTRCSVSLMAKRSLEHDWQDPGNKLTAVYLDLITYRSVSDLIAKRYEVIHQSPQVIVLRNGKAIFSAAHQDVDFAVLQEHLN